MFPDALFAFVLEQFVKEIGPAPPAKPLQTDTFIARSVMQKAIRRGMTDLALRAAVTLINTDRRVLWRRLIVTALEDLGIGEVDLLARIVSAAQDRGWRQSVGGEWPVIAALIQQACSGTRCQSANDLANVARNDPALDDFKTNLCDASLPDLLDMMCDEQQPVAHRGVAVLIACGDDAGTAAPTHIAADPGAVFAAFADTGRYSHVPAIYEDAVRQTRLTLAPLSLCLWSESRGVEVIGRDDSIPPVAWLGDIPGFALDQYTRGGLGAIRRYAYSSSAWRAFADRWRIDRRDWPKAAGELLFRCEGAVETNRRVWNASTTLCDRSATLGCFMPEEAVVEGRALLQSELPLIHRLRGEAGHIA